MGLRPASTPPAPTEPFKRHNLPEIVRAFKSFSARRINEWRGAPATPIWQRNYYEHVIRDEDDLRRIRDYVENNPALWNQDQYYN